MAITTTTPNHHWLFLRLVLIMLAALSPPLHMIRQPCCVVGASASAAASPFSSTTNKSRKVYKTLAAQVVHRHGDRSPITPLKDEAFWAQTLIPDEVQTEIARGTRLVKSEKVNTHKANGRGPFGKLTQLGLFQMIQLGTTLRERFVLSTDKKDAVMTTRDEHGNWVMPYLWRQEDSSNNADNTDAVNKPWRLLQPDQIRVISTDFERTIQSVQGLLVGLFPDGISSSSNALAETDSTSSSSGSSIAIDVRHTDWLIPDPQPRVTAEQEQLELIMAASPAMVQRERDLLPLARRTTAALHELLSPAAHEAAFGVALLHHPEPPESIETQPLGWTQLAEVTKCLALRHRLPTTISEADRHQIAAHAAWRWFHTLSVPRLAYLGMNRLVSTQLSYFEQYVQAATAAANPNNNNNPNNNPPPLTIWSAHDSTLIGLLCAYQLEQPAVWPEYASYLLLELIHVAVPPDDPEEEEQQQQDGPSADVVANPAGADETATTRTVTTGASNNNHNDNNSIIKEEDLFVRFSLNGKVLKSRLTTIDAAKDGNNNKEESSSLLVREEADDMIPLSVLRHQMQTVGATPSLSFVKQPTNKKLFARTSD